MGFESNEQQHEVAKEQVTDPKLIRFLLKIENQELRIRIQIRILLRILHQTGAFEKRCQFYFSTYETQTG